MSRERLFVDHIYAGMRSGNFPTRSDMSALMGWHPDGGLPDPAQFDLNDQADLMREVRLAAATLAHSLQEELHSWVMWAERHRYCEQYLPEEQTNALYWSERRVRVGEVLSDLVPVMRGWLVEQRLDPYLLRDVFVARCTPAEPVAHLDGTRGLDAAAVWGLARLHEGARRRL